MTRHTNPVMDLGSILANRGRVGPRRPAITFEGQTCSYGELLDRADRIAAELRAGGVGPGDRVGYAGINHPRFLETLYATARIGAIFVPLNFRLSTAEFEYILDDVEVHTLIADAERAAVIDPIRGATPLQRAICLTSAADLPKWEALDALVAARAPLTEPTPPKADDVAIIMYTSGTTGKPKGAMLTHDNLFWNNIGAMHTYEVCRSDVTLVCAPLFHIGGLNVTTLLTLQVLGHVVLMPAFDPARVLELIARHRVTTMFGVPAMFLFMSQVPGFAEADLSSVKYFICGGAPVPAPLIERYSERGVAFAQGYGLTETAPLVAATAVDETATKIGSAGHRITFISETRLFDPEGREVPVGERGEVCVRGPQVTPGYWRRPEATAAAIDADGWFHTGDVGVIDADGYVTIVDRVKDMVISGGENVYPAEVEAALFAHPAISDVAVIGLPDAKWGEVVTAVVVLKGGATLTLDDLRTFARRTLAGYKIPLRMETLDVLPRTGSGKVLKYALRTQFSP